MNNSYQRHFEIKYAVKEIVYNFMKSNGVSPLEMENALSYILDEIKEENYKSFLIELQSSFGQGQEEPIQEEREEIDG